MAGLGYVSDTTEWYFHPATDHFINGQCPTSHNSLSSGYHSWSEFKLYYWSGEHSIFSSYRLQSQTYDNA